MKKQDRILRLLDLAKPEGLTGSEIIQILGLWSGTAYILLMRLEARKRISSEWKEGPAPRQRIYRRTRSI